MYKNDQELPFTLTAKEVQEILRIGRTKTYELINSGEFPVKEVGRQKIVPTKTFLEWFYNGTA